MNILLKKLYVENKVGVGILTESKLSDVNRP